MPRFSNEVALREYSQRTGRFYRKDLVPGKSLLRLLQRHCPDSRSEQAQMDARKKKAESREASCRTRQGEAAGWCDEWCDE